MPTQSTPSRRGSSVVLIAIALVCFLAGGVLVFQGLSTAPSAGAPMPEQTFDIDPADVPDPILNPAADQPRPQTADRPAGDYTLAIPAIGTQADLIPLGLAEGNSLQLRSAINELTFWTGSAPIGSGQGSILIAGHVDDAHRGAGALYEMHTLQPADAIYVTKDGISTRWKVIRLHTVVKEALPDWVFHGTGGPRQLHLVTCGGPIITDNNGHGTYRDNVIATAVPF